MIAPSDNGDSSLLDESLFDRFKRHPTAAGVGDEALREIASNVTISSFKAGEVVHPLGEPVRQIVLVDRGRLRISVGKEAQHTIAFIASGGQFGLLAILDEVVAPVSVVADVDTTLATMACDDALRLAKQFPLWRRNLLAALGASARERMAADRADKIYRPIALIHASDQTRGVSRELTRRLAAAGNAITFYSDRSDVVEAGGSVEARSMVDSAGGMRSLSEVNAQLPAESSSSHTFFDLSLDRVGEAQELLSLCQRIYVLVRPEHERRVKDEMKRSFGRALSSRELHWVWCLEEDSPVVPKTDGPDALIHRQLTLHLPGETPSRMSHLGLARLVHDVRDARIGIALGGGAARGMAHLGVLRVLEQAGVVVDAIAGTSVGAMVGIVYAAGIEPFFAAESFARDLTPTAVEQRLPGGKSLYLIRKYRGRGWDRMLRPYLQDWTLEQLPTPITSVAADLVSGEQLRSSSGDAVRAILESINLPGISAPICRDGMTLVDGGILNNLPTDVLIAEHACDFVIAVDVGSKFDRSFSGNDPETPTDQMHEPGIFETAIRSMTVQHHGLLDDGSHFADIRIEPDVAHVDVADFQASVDIAKIGKQAAESVLDELLQQLRLLDRCLVSEPVKP